MESNIYSAMKEKYSGISEIKECLVCLSEFDDPDAYVRLTNCFHLFHSKCLD